MVKQAMACDYEGDALLLAKAARIVCKDIASHKGFHFDGKFGSGCRQESVPPTLKTILSMLLNGADLKDQDSMDSQANLSISQAILFNFKNSASCAAKNRHFSGRKPPLPLYIGMKIYTETRSKKIITQLHDLGLNVSYNIVQLLATAVCEIFRKKELWFLLSCDVDFLLLVHLTTLTTILQAQLLRVHFMARESVPHFI